MAKTTINDLIKQQMRSPTVEEIKKNPEKYRRMSEQMADIEWQMEIAPYMPKGAKIDPSKFRLHRLPESMRERGLNMKGFSVPEGAREGRTLDLPRGQGKIPADPGTVNIVGAINANNRTIAHEYRHQEGIGEESINRVIDLMRSQNQADLDNALYFLHDLEYRDFRRNFSFAKPEERANLQKEWKEVTNLYEGKGSKEALRKRIDKVFGGTIAYLNKAYQPSPFFKDLMGIKPTKEEKKITKELEKIIAKQKKDMKKSLLDAQRDFGGNTKKGRKANSLLPDAF
jgi:hypothetical protein